MLTLDHVIIFVQDLNAAMDDFRALGFTVNYGGKHGDGVTENGLIIFADGSYLELIAIVAGRSYAEASHKRLLLENGEGITGYALQSDNLNEEITALNERGVSTTAVEPGSRTRPDGQEIRWQTAGLTDAEIPFFIQDVTPRNVRVPAEGDNIQHNNGATGIRELLVQTPNFDTVCERFSSIISTPLRFGQTARFELGQSGLVLTETAADGYMLTLNVSGYSVERHQLRGAQIVMA